MKKMKIYLLLLFTSMLLAGCGEQKIDLSEYVEITYKGLNGSATATAEMNFVSLEAELWDNEIGEIDNILKLEEVEKAIKCTVDKTENVSNGDDLTVTIQWNKDIEKKYKLDFTGEKKKVEVTGLQEGKEVDLFADVTIEYTGVSPYATGNIINNSKDEFVSGVSFEFEKPNFIAAGDEVKVIANCTPENAAEEGYIVGETEKTYIAEGMDVYLSKYSDIDEKTIEDMDKQSEDLIKAALSDSYIYKRTMYPNDYIIAFDMGSIEILEIKKINSYLFLPKEKVQGNMLTKSVYNSLRQVFQITTKENKSPEGKTTYLSVLYKNIVQKKDGTIEVSILEGGLGNSFDNFEDMYQGVVLKNKDINTCEEITH